MSPEQFQEKAYEALAQTDCAGCGYDTCNDYAHALATSETADTSLCISGDEATKSALDELMAGRSGAAQPAAPVRAATAAAAPAAVAQPAPAATVPGQSPEEFQEKLYEALAQTDCAGCGFDTCNDYAHALATGETADTSLCISGEDATKEALDRLLAERSTASRPAAAPAVATTTPAPQPAAITATAAPAAAPAPAGNLQDQLYEALAQTDCAGCGYDTCNDYAHALASGETKDVSLCISGDEETRTKLTKLMTDAGKEIEGA
jgi:Na+-translocating ferredoxin:NAD+ oxidoreductase RNF subunit RnfB